MFINHQAVKTVTSFLLICILHLSSSQHCVTCCVIFRCCCPVVSVCQCFAVLEDGVLAHNLQEQESKCNIKLECDSCVLMRCRVSYVMWRLSSLAHRITIFMLWAFTFSYPDKKLNIKYKSRSVCTLIYHLFLCFTLTVEQYYTTNIQKNQLVQNDIRVAKQLQDEEDEQRDQRSTLLRQASRQL